MIPIHDNHVHLRPDGKNVEAAREFEKAGGTSLLLVNLPYKGMAISGLDDILEDYRITLRMAELVREGTGLRVAVALGPYPVLLIGLAEKMGMEGAVDIMTRAMARAGDMAQEGLCHAIGEVGRPHFPVAIEVLQASEAIMEYGMTVAAESDCAVVLHTETVDEAAMASLACMADSAGLKRSRVVKHFCPPLTGELAHGLVPSIPASRRTVREALSRSSNFMMETDFLDDPTRPGAVMSINSVPKRTLALFRSGEVGEEALNRIHSDLPEVTYGIDLSR